MSRNEEGCEELDAANKVGFYGYGVFARFLPHYQWKTILQFRMGKNAAGIFIVILHIIISTF